MSNGTVVEKGSYVKLNTRKIKKQMAAFRDSMESMLPDDEYSSSHSDFPELSEPAFIRRATCSDMDCGPMRASYIFL